MSFTSRFLEHRIMTLNLARQFSKAILVPLQLIGKQGILCGRHGAGIPSGR